ncbi:MAG: polysaccharide biosynthesis/export family protein [Luteolibacter sp.]|jgi:protein involved in polysaccharide export with SLBB domain
MNAKTILCIAAVAISWVFPVSGQTIQSNQAITITVQGVPDTDRSMINNTYPVAQNGTINMPHIGQVRAGGLLPEQLAASLQSQYRNAQIFTNPTFQVIATSSDTLVNQVVYVGGYVRSTGAKPFTNGLTLYQALQSAGGANEFGSIRRVTLYRDGVARRFDLRTEEAMHYPLRPNDTIEVPQKNWWGR